MSQTNILHYGSESPDADSFQISRTSNRSFDQVLDTLRQEIDRAGFKLLNEIDPQAVLQALGHAIGGSRLLFFFHPERVVEVMQADVSAMVEAPLKLVVTERADHTVSVRMADPAQAFGRYNKPALVAFGHRMSGTCRGLIENSL